jgi:chemotaxis family two-component system response regulator PixG
VATFSVPAGLQDFCAPESRFHPSKKAAMQIEINNSGMTRYPYRPPRKLHLLSTLAQLTSRQASGCLHVTDESQVWRLFLEQGKLVYASTSVAAFERLDRHLKRLSHQIQSLVSPVRVQVRLLFEKSGEESTSYPDYEAICWLVNQQYLTVPQAGELIEALAKEVLEDLLPLEYGNSTWSEGEWLDNGNRFCQLDVRSLVESCQIQPLRRQATPLRERGDASVPIPPLYRPDTTIAAPEPRASVQGYRDRGMTPENPGMLGHPGGRSPQVTRKSTYTIACIDDSPTVLRAIESYLDETDFQVLRIENPVSALMQIIRNKPDLILLDVTMPNLDGYELCSLLRRHPSFKTTPIVMVTSNRGLIDRAKAKLVGASSYLTKPFNQSDLLKVIFKHLN